MTKRNSLLVDGASGSPSYVGYELRALMEHLQPGVYQAGDFKVTTGTGLAIGADAGIALIRGNHPGWARWQMNYLVADDSAENSATWERFGGGTGIPANASANPRLDACVLKQYDANVDGGSRRDWVRMYVPGVATPGAALGGALPALPESSLLIAEVLVPGNNPTSIPAANIRDRRPSARGFRRQAIGVTLSPAKADATPALIPDMTVTGEFSGAPVLVGLSMTAWGTMPSKLSYGISVDGATPTSSAQHAVDENGSDMPHSFTLEITPAAGRHTFAAYWWRATGTGTITCDNIFRQLRVNEDIRPVSDLT